MFKTRKIIPILITIGSAASVAYAQNVPPNSVNDSKPVATTVQPTAISSVDPEQINKSNAYEKAVTPLLREISKKRSQLELRKLDRDLEKIDEESLKAQVQLDALLNASSNAGSNATGSAAGSSQASSAPANPNGCPTDVQVLMIYGIEGNLMAKVSAGCQGGYVVKKGDIMPDGTVVKNINANFIEVKRDSGSAPDDVVRYFVMPKPAPTMGLNTGNNIPAAALGGMSGSMGMSDQSMSGAPQPLYPTAR